MRQPEAVEPLKSRVLALDGVRGIAMILVLVAHFALVSHASRFDEGMRSVLLAGYTGLDLFFVLSGFLITGVLLEARDAPHRVRNFYMRRALRVLPLYYGVVAVLLIGLPLLRPHGTPALTSLEHHQWWYWLHGTNFIWKDPGAMPYNTAHFWSLSVEEQFYLVWPALVFGLSERRLLRVCLVCIVVALILRAWTLTTSLAPYAESFVWTRMDTLAAGGALAILIRRPEGLDPFRSMIVRGGIALAAVGFVTFWCSRAWPALEALHLTVGYSAIALSFAAFVGAAAAGWTDRVTTHSIFRFFGRYSYGMYVFHLPMLLAFGRIYVLLNRVPLAGHSIILRQLVYFAIATPLTALAGMLSWHLYEKHFLALKRFFPRDA